MISKKVENNQCAWQRVARVLVFSAHVSLRPRCRSCPFDNRCCGPLLADARLRDSQRDKFIGTNLCAAKSGDAAVGDGDGDDIGDGGPAASIDAPALAGPLFISLVLTSAGVAWRIYSQHVHTNVRAAVDSTKILIKRTTSRDHKQQLSRRKPTLSEPTSLHHSAAAGSSAGGGGGEGKGPPVVLPGAVEAAVLGP